MKKLLFVYPKMSLGGSTTSLLSLLSCLSADEYDIDLLLFYSGGEYEHLVPPHIHILPYAYRFQNPRTRRLLKYTRPRFLAGYLKSRAVTLKYGDSKAGEQYVLSRDVDAFRYLDGDGDGDTEYDVAIGYLEGYSNIYTADHTKAKRKIAWLHIDYEASGFHPEFDIDHLSRCDSIVTVSGDCRDSFCRVFPSLAQRCVAIENILSNEYVRGMAEHGTDGFAPEAGCLNLVSVCRIHFATKALDRAVSVLARMKNDGVPGFDTLRWYIVGDGPDMSALISLVHENRLDGTVILLGRKINPYPYEKGMSVFFLPSLWEGKPMAVTEGFILGLPALVTCYASAADQVSDGVDGMIVDNNADGIYRGLTYLLANPDKIAEWTENVGRRDYSNTDEIKAVTRLFDGEQSRG